MKVLVVLMLFMASVLYLGQVSASNAEERLNQLENTVMDLQVRSYLNKVNWSGSFIVNIDQYNSEGYSSGAKNRALQAYQSAVRLNGNVDVSERISFYSTIKAAFDYNNSFSGEQEVADNLISDASGSYIRVNKAYIDAKLIEDDLVFSVGRLATEWGPPQHIRTGEERLGTYVALGYSLPFDGFAASWKLRNTFALKDNLTLRFFYTPLQVTNGVYPERGVEVGSGSNVAGLMTESGASYIAMVEFDSNRLPWLEKFTFNIQYFNITLGRGKESEARGVLSSQITGDTNVYRIAHPNEHSFSANIWVGYLELKNIFSTDLTFYASYKYTDGKQKGEVRATIIEDNMSVPGFGVGSSFSLGGVINSSGDVSASSALYGLSYNVSQNLFLGTEYVTTNVGTVPTVWINIHRTQLYNWIGDGIHLYSFYKLKRHGSTIRVGYINFDQDHLFNGLNYQAADVRVRNVYANYLLRF